MQENFLEAMIISSPFRRAAVKGRPSMFRFREYFFISTISEETLYWSAGPGQKNCFFSLVLLA